MYAILDDVNVVIGFEKREIPLENLVHPDFLDHYIFTADKSLKVGDVYDKETELFTITPIAEPEPMPELLLSEAEQTQLEIALNIEYLICLAELND